MDEIRQKTGLSQTDLVSGLRELFHHQTIESVMGNGQGNHRYRLIKSASIEFLDKPENESVKELRDAVAQEPKGKIKAIEPLLLAAAEITHEPVVDKTPHADEKQDSQSAVSEPAATAVTLEIDQGPDETEADVKAKSVVQKRDARGHFLPMPGKRKRRSRAKLATKAPAKAKPSPQSHESADAAKSEDASPFEHRGTTLPGENRIKRVREADGLMVLTLERRPGGPSVSISLEDAIILGQEAVKELMKRRAAQHH